MKKARGVLVDQREGKGEEREKLDHGIFWHGWQMEHEQNFLFVEEIGQLKLKGVRRLARTRVA